MTEIESLPNRQVETYLSDLPYSENQNRDIERVSFMHFQDNLEDFPSVSRSDSEQKYGYSIQAIEQFTGTNFDGVILDILSYGSSEPVVITHNTNLHVQAIQGQGYGVISNDLRNTLDVVLLREGCLPIKLGFGDAYYYVNSSPQNLVLKEVSTPPFREEFELALTVDNPKMAGIDGRHIEMPIHFWTVKAALKSLPHDKLAQKLINQKKILMGQIYEGNHRIRYKTIGMEPNATNYEKTHKINEDIVYVQLDDGEVYKRGQIMHRSSEDFICGKEIVGDKEVHALYPKRFAMDVELIFI